MPPAHIVTGTISGTVTDASNKPLPGITVSLAFQGSGPVNPTAVTGSDGTYTIHGVPQGHYRELQAAGHGRRATRTVTAPTTSADFTLG
jgi:protocatechuate 3,4-dioxygenase beta subunit